METSQSECPCAGLSFLDLESVPACMRRFADRSIDPRVCTQRLPKECSRKVSVTMEAWNEIINKHYYTRDIVTDWWGA